MRARRFGCLVISLFMITRTAAADSYLLSVRKERAAAREAAQRVQAAVRADDSERVRALAAVTHRGEWRDRATRGCSPWLVVEALCDQQAIEAARRFVHAVSSSEGPALRAYVDARRAAPPSPDRARAYRAYEAGLADWQRGTFGAAERVLAAAPDTSRDVVHIEALIALGWVVKRQGRYDDSARIYRRAAAEARALGWTTRAAQALGRSAYYSAYIGDYTPALQGYTQQLAWQRERKHVDGIERATSNVADCRFQLGDYKGALAGFETVLAMYEEGSREHDWKHDEVARTLHEIAGVHMGYGNYAAALDVLDQAVEKNRARGNSGYLAANLTRMGRIHVVLGDRARALDLLDEATTLKITTPIQRTAQMLATGVVYGRLGDWPRAHALFASALAVTNASQHAHSRAEALTLLGEAADRLGTPADAMRHLRAAHDLYGAMDDPIGSLETTIRLGWVQQRAGNLTAAHKTVKAALAAQDRLQDRTAAARVHHLAACLAQAQGDKVAAAAHYATALRRAGELRDAETLVRCSVDRARARLAVGDAPGALADASAAAEALPRLVSGVVDQLAISAREQWSDLFATGMRAARATGDLEQAWRFLELGRARSLAESLGGAGDASERGIPPALAQATAGARRREATATRRYRDAVASGKRKAIAARFKELVAAQDATRAAMDRLRRVVKRGIPIQAAAPALSTLRARLEPGQSFVHYVSLDDRLLALVVSPAGARWVDLGATARVQSVAGDIQSRDAAALRDVLARLTKAVIEPLGLGKDCSTLLVVPGPLDRIPLGLLDGRRATTLIPSATAYLLLAERPRHSGQNILAVGDPDIGRRRTARTLAVLRDHAALAPLPFARKEAMSVGTRVLVGRGATEHALRLELRRRSAWRAVHFACHGLAETKAPLMSSLLLAPSPEDDGFLRAWEVLALRVRADLVTLSACRSSGGRLSRNEGVPGLPYAFFCAGAARVLVSLWEIDDEATCELMKRFYAAWTKRGATAAAALRAAQAHIAAQPRWVHPRFWAGWQLWGLSR
ncbi:MAG: CHAT domain-containing tetratricopeptide repeat protein [Planctomycetota bacterium]|nr:CHAT domain-containing tetratricopeptide repeat protein [Planctomycetota bacterium]